jgi:hypothetical protein
MDAVPQTVTRQGEPRWPALIAMIAVGGIFYALPPALKIGPDWLVLVIVVLLVTPGTFLRRHGRYLPAQIFGASGLAVLLPRCVAGAPGSSSATAQETPAQLLRAATALWSSNVPRICVGTAAPGPEARTSATARIAPDGAFLFPQMTLTHGLRKEMGEDQWSPHYVDYLFLAFNTSTAFSPTDVRCFRAGPRR